MSRGLGRLQVAILLAVEQATGSLDTYELAALGYAKTPDEEGRILLSRAEIAAAHRALTGLAEAGSIVALGRHFRGGRARWASERVGIPIALERLQMLNQMDAQDGNVAAVLGRVDDVVRLARRANELGVDTTRGQLSAPTP